MRTTMRLCATCIIFLVLAFSQSAMAQDITQEATWSSAKKIGSAWQAFEDVIGGDDGIMYALTADGGLHFYQDKNRTGTANWTSATVGSGWQGFSKIFGGPDGIIYAVESDGNLKQYVDKARDGTKDWRAVDKIADGWDAYTHAFGGHDGVIYTINANGDLMFHKDKARNGTIDWAPSKKIGDNWGDFIHVFGGQNGVIYAVDAAGNLRVYKDKSRNGTADWDVQHSIGSGWQHFDKAWGGEDGVIYARKPNGDLYLYKVSYAGAAGSSGSTTAEKLCVPGSNVCIHGTWTENGDQRTLTGTAELELPGGIRLPLDNTSFAATVGDGFAVTGSASWNLDLGGIVQANLANAEFAIGSGKNLKALGMSAKMNVSNLTAIDVTDAGFYIQVKYNQVNNIKLGPVVIKGAANTGNELIIDTAGPNVYLAGNVPAGVFPYEVKNAKFLYLGKSKFDYTLAAVGNKKVKGNLLIGGDIPSAPFADAGITTENPVPDLFDGLPHVTVSGTMILDIDKDNDGNTMESGDDFSMALVGDITLHLPTFTLLEGSAIELADAGLYFADDKFHFGTSAHSLDGWTAYDWPFIQKQPSSSGVETGINGSISKSTADIKWTYKGNAQTFGLLANGVESTTHLLNNTVTYTSTVNLAGIETPVSGSVQANEPQNMVLKGEFVVGNYNFGTDSVEITQAGGAVIDGAVTWANRSWAFTRTKVTTATTKIKSTAVKKSGTFPGMFAGIKVADVSYNINGYFMVDSGTPKVRADATCSVTWLTGDTTNASFDEIKLSSSGEVVLQFSVLGIQIDAKTVDIF